MGQPHAQGSCNRHDCDRPRDAAHHPYCSATCKAISRETHGGPLPAPQEWTWAPRRLGVDTPRPGLEEAS